MCTLTAYRNAASTIISMTRDERYDRAAETPPFTWETHPIIAPRDGHAGGTWIGINPHTRQWAALLNGYAHHDHVTHPHKSRGVIIPELLDSEDMGHFVEELNIHDFSSFRLMYGNDKVVHEFYWDGRDTQKKQFEIGLHGLIWSSSSWAQDEVTFYRRELFTKWQASPEYGDYGIPSFHFLSAAQDARATPLMQRDNAGTRSITSITIPNPSSQKPVMHYIPRKDITPVFV